MPAIFQKQNLDQIIVDKLGIECKKDADLSEWNWVVDDDRKILIKLVEVCQVGRKEVGRPKRKS